MLFAFAYDVNKNVIKVHYHENVKILCQDLVDVALKHGRCIGQSKKHDLVLKVAITSLKGHLLFIIFFDSHMIVSIGQIELGETLSLLLSIQ